MNRVLTAAIGATALVLGTAGVARAQMPVQKMGNFYVGVSGGIIIPEDLDASFTGALVGTGKLSFKTGPAATGRGGYHFNEYLALEGEVGYASFDEKSFSGTLNGINVSFPITGRVNTFLGFANAIVTPAGTSGFSPYVGAGVGVIYFDEKIDTIGGVPLDTTSKATKLAANGIVGFDFALWSQWSMGARYRFVWANTSNTSTSGGITTQQRDFTAQAITANVTFRF